MEQTTEFGCSTAKFGCTNDFLQTLEIEDGKKWHTEARKREK
jgi:hypothetical protein